MARCFQIVKKQNPGFEPYYEFQKRIHSLFSTVIFWSADRAQVEREAEKYIQNLKKCSDPEVIRVWTV